MDQPAVDRLLARQAGVISRRQVIACGGRDHDIARLLRRRLWARVHDGVYVNHTGQLTWDQRAWAAVLYYAPAALDGDSALRAYGLRRAGSPRRDDEPLRVVIADHRCVTRVSGVKVARIAGFADSASLHLSPPRTTLERSGPYQRRTRARRRRGGGDPRRRRAGAAHHGRAVAGRPG
jgi:hypothetical protein